MSKAKFMKIAADAGIEVLPVENGIVHPRTGETLNYIVPLDAPAGKLFSATGCHSDCGCQGLPPNGRGVNWNEAIGFLQDLISNGFEDCTDAECAKSANERKADERKRMREKGFVLLHVWVHSEDRNKVVGYINAVSKRREK